MIQLKPIQLYAVKVPESATEFITGIGKEGKAALGYYVEFANNREFRFEDIDFIVEPIGTYQSGKIDFDAGEYVSTVFNNQALWTDYNNYNLYKETTLDSFTSLLEANQVPIHAKHVILKLK